MKVIAISRLYFVFMNNEIKGQALNPDGRERREEAKKKETFQPNEKTQKHTSRN